MPKSFRATLERMESRLNWVIVPIPFDVEKTWGMRGQVKVKGEINNFAFRTSLFPASRSSGKTGHFLLVNKRMQAGAEVGPGDNARFMLEQDKEERVAEVPAEFKAVLAEDRALKRWYEALNYSTRREI